ILIAFFLNNNALMSALIAAAALAFNLLNRIGGRAKSWVSSAFVSVIWSMALTLTHRGAYLFVPITIFAWLLWLITSNIISSRFTRSTKTISAISLALPLVC